VIGIHRKDVAKRDDADAILSTLRVLLEENVSGFIETHGPDEEGWILVEFDSPSTERMAAAAVADCLCRASDSWREHLDPPTVRTVNDGGDV
jgi:hypothetical protein